MVLEVSYPAEPDSLEPLPLKAAQVWALAAQVRARIDGRRARLDIRRLIQAARRLRVNGVQLATHWDLSRRVLDAGGREALGATEADPSLPGELVVSLNGEAIAGRDYLLRSTAAHEFGHAVFDGPSMLLRAGRRALATVTPDEWHLSDAGQRDREPDWREFRANEFMGGLLVPRRLLQGELVRRAAALGLPLADGGEDLPVLAAGAEPDRAEQLLLDLGERFGVSADFIHCRLRRYRLAA